MPYICVLSVYIANSGFSFSLFLMGSLFEITKLFLVCVSVYFGWVCQLSLVVLYESGGIPSILTLILKLVHPSLLSSNRLGGGYFGMSVCGFSPFPLWHLWCERFYHGISRFLFFFRFRSLCWVDWWRHKKQQNLYNSSKINDNL